MATATSSIDDMLLGGGSSMPTPPEMDITDNVEDKEQNAAYETVEEDESNTESTADESTQDDASEDEKPREKPEYDDYGNVKKASKTYTEDEVNERINKAVRERLARLGTENQPPQPQQRPHTNQAQEFEYNPESGESWQVQLEQFVEQTVSRMSQKQIQQQHAQREHQAQAEFEDKFVRGMDRFSDFRDVVGAQPIDDPMTYALRGMTDPAAFIYAAAKRNPAELQRIANIPDPYAKMVEMGKLEERMRKTSSATKAPKPISRTKEDGSMPESSNNKKEPSIEDLIAKSEAKRRALMVAKRGR